MIRIMSFYEIRTMNTFFGITFNYVQMMANNRSTSYFPSE